MADLMLKWRQMAERQKVTSTARSADLLIAEPKLEGLNVTFGPLQSGSGTPAPDNVRAIGGWSDILVSMCGKNIYDAANVEIADQKVRNSSGVETNDSMEAYTKTPIPVIPGSTVTISGIPNSTNTKRVYYLNGAKGWLYRDDHSSSKQQFTITIPNNCSYIQLQLRRTEAVWSGIQIEYGSTATAFEAYRGITPTISLGDTYCAGTVDFLSGTLTVTHIYKAFSSSDFTAYYPAGSTYSKRVCTSKATMAGISTGSGNPQGAVLANCMTCKANGSQNSTIATDAPFLAMSGTAGNTSLFLMFPDSYNVTDLASAQTWITNHPIHGLFTLATPRTVTLTPQTVAALRGLQTVSSPAGNVGITYWTI